MRLEWNTANTIMSLEDVAKWAKKMGIVFSDGRRER